LDGNASDEEAARHLRKLTKQLIAETPEGVCAVYVWDTHSPESNCGRLMRAEISQCWPGAIRATARKLNSTHQKSGLYGNSLQSKHWFFAQNIKKSEIAGREVFVMTFKPVLVTLRTIANYFLQAQRMHFNLAGRRYGFYGEDSGLLKTFQDRSTLRIAATSATELQVDHAIRQLRRELSNERSISTPQNTYRSVGGSRALVLAKLAVRAMSGGVSPAPSWATKDYQERLATVKKNLGRRLLKPRELTMSPAGTEWPRKRLAQLLAKQARY